MNVLLYFSPIYLSIPLPIHQATFFFVGILSSVAHVSPKHCDMQIIGLSSVFVYIFKFEVKFAYNNMYKF